MSAPTWLHGVLTRDEAESLAKQSSGLPEGAFCIRERSYRQRDEPPDLTMMVIFKGRCTHHLIERDAAGMWTINKRIFGEPTADLRTLVRALERPGVQGWPVPLTVPIVSLSTNPVPSPAALAVTTDPEARIATPSALGSNEATPEDTQDTADVLASDPYYPNREMARPTTRVRGDALPRQRSQQSLVGSDAAALEVPATIRMPADPTDEAVVVTTTAFPPAETGRMLASSELPPLLLDTTNSPSQVNPDGPLTTALERSAEDQSAAVLQAVAKGFITRRAIATGRLRVRRPWLHGDIGRTDAEDRAVSFFGARPLEEGAFLVRPRPQHSGHWALMCCYKGKLTHHLIEPSDGGVFAINRNTMGDLKTLDQVIEHLRHHTSPTWPVRLTTAIPPPQGEVVDLNGLAAGVLNVETKPSSAYFPTYIRSATEPIELLAVNKEDLRGTVGSYNADAPLDTSAGAPQPIAVEESSTEVRSPEELAKRYLNPEPATSSWKCGYCGQYNNDITSDGEAQRSCLYCRNTRGKRGDVSEHLPQAAVAIAAPPSKPVDPIKQAARVQLNEALLRLPEEYCVAIREALAAFAARHISTTHLVNEMSAVLQKVDTTSRKSIEKAIGNLIPHKVQAQYSKLLKISRKEEYLSVLMRQTTQGDVRKLSQCVLDGLAVWLGQEEMMLNPAERRAHCASVARGWAVLRWQADDVNMDYFDIELIAKEIHTGWSRAVLVDWDLDSYGPSIRVPPVFNAHGWLDSVNFGSAHAYDVYRGRAMLAARPYLLNGLDDDGVPVESIAPSPGLNEAQKRGYRVAAEILLDLFRTQFRLRRMTLRLDRELVTKLRHLGIVADLHDDLELDMAPARPGAQPRAGLPSYQEEIARHGEGVGSREFGFVA